MDGAILVRGDKIADIGKADELLSKYPEEEKTNLTGRIMIPGLISTHMHTAQTLLRGTNIHTPKPNIGTNIFSQVLQMILS